MELVLPYKYKPREYQLPLLQAIDNWYNRAFCLWHRRAWKDITLFNLLIKKSYENIWIYYYFLPTYTQAKKVIWDWITIGWMKFLDYIPKSIIEKKNATEMKIKLINWSLIQLIGTDSFDSIRGTNPIWCIFSEYAYQNPQAYEVIKPILKVNKWFAIFNSTPNWMNHAFDLWNMALNNDKWYTEKLTVNETLIVTKEEIQEEVQEWMDKDLIQQEYYCSFEWAVKWSYYWDQLKQAREENRICKIPYEPTLDVFTYWDLWVNDTNSIWFAQYVGKEIRLIDYYENNNHWVEHYLQIIKEKNYNYWWHYFPHDIEVREYTTWRTRKDTILEMWINEHMVHTVDKINIADWIQSVRRMFNRCWFDNEKCFQWLRCLQDYHKEYDEKKKVYRNKPAHNWSSNWSDAFRYLAVSPNHDEWINDNYVYEEPNLDPY